MTYDAKYHKRWNYDRAHGRMRLTDAEPALLHISGLIGAGWSRRSIAGAAGVGAGVISNVLNRHQLKVSHRISAAILAVDPSSVPSHPSRQTTEPFVPRIGTRRRLEALLFMGWPWSYLLQNYGIRPALAHQQGRWVTRTTHDRVARAYRDLSHRRGPSDRTHRFAASRGYPSPASWDDIDLDFTPELDAEEAAG